MIEVSKQVFKYIKVSYNNSSDIDLSTICISNRKCKIDTNLVAVAPTRSRDEVSPVAKEMHLNAREDARICVSKE